MERATIIDINMQRRRSTLDPAAKRAAISRLTSLCGAAAHRAPSQAAKLLEEIWAARQSLDWGCRPVVGR